MNKKIRSTSKVLASYLLSFVVMSESLYALELSGNGVSFQNHIDDKSNTHNGGIGTLGQKHILKTVIVKVNVPFSKDDKNFLYENGVYSVVYAGDMSYYLYGDSSVLNDAKSLNNKIIGLAPMKSEYKITKESQKNIGLKSYAYSESLNLNLLLLQEMDKEELEGYFEKFDIKADVLKATKSIRLAKIRIISDDFDKLKSLPIIQYIENSKILANNDTFKASNTSIRELKNIDTAKYAKVIDLWNRESLSGLGMKIGIVDGGQVRSTHQEFNKNGYSRVIVKDQNSEISQHGTHVAGTIGARGVKESAKGMAYNSTIYSYSFNNDNFAEASLRMSNEDGVLFSNHSYGYTDKIELATYDAIAATQDRVIVNNPFINMFEAAGNDGADKSYPHLGIIKGPGNSKNIFTVGALNTSAKSVADFSSKGPVKDGRIKPDFCTRGAYVYSTGGDSDSDYLWMSGTSMASPSSAGIGLLVAQEYQRVTDGYDIRHDVLKSVLVNTSVDIERKGPDYESGFGKVDAFRAVEVVKSLSTNYPLIHIDNISNAQTKVFSFNMSKSGTFKSTISWVDPEANPASTKTLVNDLDMWLEDSYGKKYYSYTLDKDHPYDIAKQNRFNRVDNVEQVEVKNLPAGEYKLVVKGYQIVTSAQDFTIASNVCISKNSNMNIPTNSNIKNYMKVIQNSIEY